MIGEPELTPYISIETATDEEFEQRFSKLNFDMQGLLAVRKVRGQDMRCKAALFDEFSAALQFPGYFGRNWDAFEECLTDLEWIFAKGLILTVKDTESVLSDDDPEQFRTFLQILLGTAQFWSRSGHSKSFKTVLHCRKENLDRLLQRSPSELGSIPIV